jgi:hypothetical protein
VKATRIGEGSLFADEGESERELVLKANGRFFGADKIQNEVGCLRIMRHYCPGVPTPEVHAWSEDGRNMVLAAPRGGEERRIALPIGSRPSTHGGWILLSRLPGRPLSSFDFDMATRCGISKQLGDMAAIWRKNIPAQRKIGNIQFHEDIHNSEPDIVIGGMEERNLQRFVIRGLLMDDVKVTTPVTSVYEQYQRKLQKKLSELGNCSTYSRNKRLIPRIKEFINRCLPHLEVNTAVPPAQTSPARFILTHYDLSPRNVLISGSPPEISGIVDFEFAGFFGEPEEFLNDSVGNDDDWHPDVYDAYLTQLEMHGVVTPRNGFPKHIWDTLRSLERLSENIAPWWLPGPYVDVALDEELAKAEVLVLEQLSKLGAML